MGHNTTRPRRLCHLYTLDWWGFSWQDMGERSSAQHFSPSFVCAIPLLDNARTTSLRMSSASTSMRKDKSGNTGLFTPANNGIRRCYKLTADKFRLEIRCMFLTSEVTHKEQFTKCLDGLLRGNIFGRDWCY